MFLTNSPVTETLSHQKNTTVPSYASVPTGILVSLKEPSLSVKNEILQVQKLSPTELSSLALDIVSIFPVKGANKVTGV